MAAWEQILIKNMEIRTWISSSTKTLINNFAQTILDNYFIKNVRHCDVSIKIGWCMLSLSTGIKKDYKQSAVGILQFLSSPTKWISIEKFQRILIVNKNITNRKWMRNGGNAEACCSVRGLLQRGEIEGRINYERGLK